MNEEEDYCYLCKSYSDDVWQGVCFNCEQDEKELDDYSFKKHKED